MTITNYPLVSIAMCTFNGALHLREQLESLLAQDWPRLEIIAIDDASSDETPKILEEFSSRDLRIQFSQNIVNQGYQKNFEEAISRCQGQWIAPCDQDDIWLPNKISALMAAIVANQSILVYCDSVLMNARGESMGKYISDQLNCFSTDDPLPYWFRNNASGHAMLFERSLLDQALPFPKILFHDWWLAYVAASIGHVSFLNQSLVRYRQHPYSITDITGSREKPAIRQRGFRSRELKDFRMRLELFASISGKGQALAKELLTLWIAREKEYFSFRLALFLWKHRYRLHGISKESKLSSNPFRTLRYVWGLKAKRLVEPHRYDDHD